MRIVLLGHPGSGTTTLLTDARAALRDPASGVALRPRSPIGRWRLWTASRRARRPQRDERPRAYPMRLRHAGGGAVVRVVDGGGGSVRGSSGTSGTRRLLAELAAADAIVAAVDATVLCDDPVLAASQVRTLVVLIRRRVTEALRHARSSPFPVVLALTGCERLPLGRDPFDLDGPLRPLRIGHRHEVRVAGVTVPLRADDPALARALPLLWCLHHAGSAAAGAVAAAGAAATFTPREWTRT
ncbi:hypothetical protein [Virgisporangium ochraceum]|uniref:Uncharacterized protein n=1 Tax=Virgisporangium ochraceum TaxID=65505 RepID=A0A8J4A049_9ACTN|nr:hypothetical protein [Virgisporangium ochraceum]GIJ70521.1 hypothetical protein Voc01_054380 [Virgisporangium ochraceum]